MPKSDHMSAAAVASAEGVVLIRRRLEVDLPERSVGLEPVAATVAAEAVLDQQLFGGFGIELPPAGAKDLMRRAGTV